MEFQIKRTSGDASDSNTPPVPGAYSRPWLVRQEFEDGHALYLDALYGHRPMDEALAAWKTLGVNDREEGGKHVHDLVWTRWFIDLPDLEALLALRALLRSEGVYGSAQKPGEIILTDGDEDDGIPCLEILDGWRE